MADKSGIDVLLNFVVNNNQAIKNIKNIDNSIKNNTKIVNDNSTTVKNNTKTINDSRTIINNKTVIVNKNTDAVNKNTSSYGSLKVMLAGVAAAFGVLMKTASAAAIEFDASMRNVNSIARLTEDQFKRLSEGAREVAKMSDVRDTANGVAKAMYQLVSSGFEGAKALELAAVASKAASAGLTSTETAVNALSTLMNAYNMKTLPDAIKFSDQLFKTVDAGVITFEQLSTNLGTVIAQASTAGISFEEVGAAFISLTKVGINASEAETAIANLIRSIVDPDDGVIKAAKEMGLSWNAVALEQKGLVGMMQDLDRVTGGAIEKIAMFVPEARAQKAALTLSKNGVSEYTDALNKMASASDGAGATQTALNEQMKATQFTIDKTKGYIEDLKIEFGTLIKDAMVPLLYNIQEIIKFILSLDDSTKQTIVTVIKIGTVLVGLGTAVGGVILSIKLFLPAIAAVIGGAGAGLIGLHTAFWALVTIFSPTGAFIIAVAAGVAAVKSLEHIINQVKDAYGWLLALSAEKQAWSALEKEKEQAKELIKEYNKLKATKKEISAEDAKKYSRAMAVRLSDVKSPGARASLQKEAGFLSDYAEIKARQDANKKALDEQIARDRAAAARSVNVAKDIKDKKAKIEDDYKNKIKQSQDEIARLRKDAADQEARLTKSDLEYKMYSIQQERAEKEKIIKEAISLGTASDKDLIQLRKNTTAELLKVWKEYSDKITADQKEAAEKAQKEDQDYYDFTQDALNDIEKIRLDKLEKRRQKEEETLKAEQEAQDKYYTTITAAVSRYTGESLSSFTRLFDMQKKFRDGVLTEGDIYAAAIDTIGNSISIAFDAFDKLNQKIKEGTANAKDFWNYTLELIRAVPGVGEALSGLISKIGSFFGGGNTDEQNKTLVNAMNTINKLITDALELKKKHNEELKKIEAKYEDAILDKKRDVINRAYELEKDTINKTYEARKDLAKQAISDYEKQISRLKSDIEKIDDELAKRAQKQAASKETSAAFAAQRKSTIAGLSAEFFRSPVDVFEIENQSAIADLQNKFNIGDISQDKLNKELMGLAVKRNIFYQHVADSLQKGTKENLEWQKKANSAYTDYAELQQESTEEKLRADKQNYESQMSGFESLKQTQLSDIAEIEKAHQMAIINLDRTWKTPAGAFRLSMELALEAVAGKMDLTFNDFVERSKTLINTIGAQKQIEVGKQNLGGGLGGLGGATGAAASASASGLSAIKIPIPLPGGQTMWIEPFKKTSGSGSVLGSNVGRPNFGGLPGFANGGIMNASGAGSPAILHGSEMILNPFQQANLFNMINAGAGGGGINVIVNTGAINTPADLKSLAVMVGNEVKKAVNRKY